MVEQSGIVGVDVTTLVVVVLVVAGLVVVVVLVAGLVVLVVETLEVEVDGPVPEVAEQELDSYLDRP